ncbi:MAG: sugar phosphate isomerase/epimerase [Lachnospiraceae bacterium]|nr:sugar phosphate isomerase/epimerase [Lachnospiraceae bacterium]
MKQVLIIPDRDRLPESLELAAEYGVGFEYNDFFAPDVLDDIDKKTEIIEGYSQQDLPVFTTLHGAFYDVIPFSPDAKIREIADIRIRQSIWAAKRIGARAVVFHTSYNPRLNSKGYVQSWLLTNVAYWSGILKENPDLNIYLENTFETHPDILEALSEELCQYENYGVCFDYAHAVLSKVSPEIWAKKLGRFVKHVHINDNDGSSDLHLAWGDGVIDRAEFYACYEEYLQGATVLVETSVWESKVRSLEVLKQEGFLE